MTINPKFQVGERVYPSWSMAKEPLMGIVTEVTDKTCSIMWDSKHGQSEDEYALNDMWMTHNIKRVNSLTDLIIKHNIFVGV